MKLYKISTSEMNDYGRNGAKSGNWSRYGAVNDLDATTETAALKKGRSFTFVIDALDQNQTGGTLAGASALARQLREVVVPEVDTYVYGVMCSGAGHKPAAVALTKDNIYDEIIKASAALDDALVPETGRVLTVTHRSRSTAERTRSQPRRRISSLINLLYEIFDVIACDLRFADKDFFQ